MIAAAWICLISPLVAAFLITLGWNRLSRRGAGYLATLSVAVSFVAAIVSFVGLFQLLGVVFLVVVPLVLLMKRPRAGSGAGAAAH